MRARTIVVILVVAVGLGLLVGGFVLPARSTLTAPSGATPPSSGSRSPAPTPKPASAKGHGTEATPIDTPAPTPTEPATATPAGAVLSIKNLLQKSDFYQQGVMPVSATVGTRGIQALSACSGEETMRDLTKGKVSAYAVKAWTFDTNDISLTESLAEVSFDVAADSYETQLNELVRRCQSEPAGHWHYGKANSISVIGGAGTWYPVFDGNGQPAGGVAVIRSGRRFGIVELAGQPSDDPTYMQGITAPSINRMSR